MEPLTWSVNSYLQNDVCGIVKTLTYDIAGIRSMGVKGRRINTGQSREETIANARRKFQEVAIALKGLSEYHIDQGVQCYKSALAFNFTQGRKQGHVIAACLYIVCRREKTMHLLIDFSDVLHTNVFILGATYLKLIKTLNIYKDMPIIDPSLYLSRFAAQLGFDDKTQAVTTDALRLVQRMKRDWIHYGRRPSGICGACLLIAARMHGFQRSQEEIIRVVKICDLTLRKRLNEFAGTESAELSIEEFRSTDLSHEGNPPAFSSPKRHTFIITAANPSACAPNSTNPESLPEDATSIESEMRSALRSSDLRTAANTWTDTSVDQDPANWSDLDDGELSNFLLDDQEINEKTELWEDLNKDWEEKQELKRQRALEKGETSATTAASKAKRARKHPAKNKSSGAPAENANDVTKRALHKKVAPKISKKINYAVLDNLFVTGTASASSEQVASSSPSSAPMAAS